MFEQMPDGTIIYYSENKDFLYKKLKDGTIEYNNPEILKKSYDGNIIFEEYKDGTQKYYNSDSILYRIEKGDNEIEYLAGRNKADLDYNRPYNNYELYNDNGKIIKKYVNGKCIYDEYPSGQVRLKKLENGGEVQYNEDGSLETYANSKGDLFWPPSNIKCDIKIDNNDNDLVYIVDSNDENIIYKKIYNNELIEVNNYLDLDKVTSESVHYASDGIIKTYINNRLIKTSASNYNRNTKEQITHIQYMDGNAERYINGNIKEKYDANTKALTIYDELGNIEKIEQ